MSGIFAHVENLTDAELYNELKKHGFPAGPVVASTRRLYRRKLCQLLEGICGHEQEPLQDNDELEEELTHPVRLDDSIGESKPEYPRAGSGLSHIRPSYSHSGEVLGKSSSSLSDTDYSRSREQRKDDLRSRFSLSSSYLGASRGLQNDEVNDKAGSSWLSRGLSSSVAQTSTSLPRRMYGSSTDNSFGKTSWHSTYSQVTEENPGYSSRQRGIFSDTSPGSRQEMASHYRFTGYSDVKPSLLHRHNQERQRNRSINWTLQLILFTALVVGAVALSYVVYNAWSENDPYRQIEEDVSKLIEEMKPVGN